MDLHAFGVDDHELFFGRDRLVVELLERVRRRLAYPGIQVVTGPSGVGKSSLLQAGMMHAIAAGQLVPGSAAWDQLPPFTPGTDPLVSLASALAPHLPPGDYWRVPAAAQGSRLLREPSFVTELFSGLRPTETDDADRRVILVIDQFEEIFTACRDEAVRLAFIDALRAAALPGADGSSPAALVIVGLRSDFLGACSAYPGLSDALGPAAFVVGPMSREELRQAIVRPAETVGLGLEDGLVEVLMRDADPGMALARSDISGQGILPLLSHALYVSWQYCEYDSWQDSDGRAHQGWSIKTASYRASGGIQGALSASAEAVYEGLDADLHEQARHILLSLVHSLRIADAPVETRRRARRAEFRSSPGGRRAADAVINAFAAARLLTVDGDHVEIAHEALLNTWPRLRGWIDADRERLQVRRQVAEAALTWRSEGQHPSELLQGPRLVAASGLLAGAGRHADLWLRRLELAPP